MKQSKNIKTDPKPIRYPKVTYSHWQFSGKIWRTYQLSDGEKLMSDRQMALLVGRSKKAVKKFIESRRLETHIVRVGNGRLVKVYPLSVAAIYLSTLLREGHLQKHRFNISRDDWYCIIKALSDSESESNPILNCYFFTGNYLVESGEPLQVRFDANISLQVLVLHSGEYRIDYREGLRYINRSVDWFIHESPKKAKSLANLGLSRDIVECRIRIQEEFQSMYALSLQDWLSIWGYFAKKGNRKAIALLNACAREGIEALIAKAIEEGRS
jgi:hypothetical protein